ncbi:MAG: hypothetical protein CVV22_08870 [Ignavibacteriae bacterium HGW-Ignavibacteriae-1]|jgi:hypothetical protein|nr:MAG: hypothetical protein CVV22_08870 [Ignavibacteriae bacterium HGW-Ignavibacteriae-1]
MFSKLKSWFKSLHLQILATLIILPSTILVSQIDTVDILPPVLWPNSGCGEFAYVVTENRNFQLNADTFNLDAGISNEPIFYDSLSKNLSKIKLNSDFIPGKKNYRFSFTMSVIDKYKEAFGLFALYDASPNNNFIFDSVRYVPELLEFSPMNLSYGNVFIGNSAQLESKLTNITDSTIEIKELRLANSTVFKIVSIEPDIRFIEPKESIIIKIEYSPIENPNSYDYDFDSLIVKTNCLEFVSEMFGTGVKPYIQVDDIDFGAIPIGSKLCNDEQPLAPGVRIYNQGNGHLIIKDYIPPDIDGPFYVLETMASPIKGRVVMPTSEIYFKSICFEPTQQGEFFDEVVFRSNATGTDSICKLRAIAYFPGVHFLAVNFGSLRVGDTLEKFIVIRNDSDAPIDLTNVFLDKATTEFKILSQKAALFPTANNPVTIYPKSTQEPGKITELLIPVQYMPINEGYLEIRINLEISRQGVQSIPMFNYVRGNAYLPKLFAKGYNFAERTPVNNVSSDTGFVYLHSFSQTADLRIKKIEVEKTEFPGINDFIFTFAFPRDIVLYRNSSLRLPVIFRPEGAGHRSIKVVIYHDAYKGKTDPLRYDTTIVYLTGEGYNKVLAFENLLFDNVFHCTESTGKLKLSNISTDKEAFIMDMKIISGDIDAFEIDVEEIYTEFVILQPGESFEVNVTFKPDIYYKNNFESVVRVFSDVDTATAILKATTRKYDLAVKLDTLNNVIPGMLTLLREKLPMNREFPISLVSDNLADLGIRKFDITLKFGKNDLRYFDQVEPGLGIIDWHTLDAQLIQFDDKYNLLHIWGEGDSDLIIGEDVIKPGFIVMLGDSGTINVEIHDATFYTADSCAVYTLNPGQMHMSYCGSHIRNLIISNLVYGIWAEQIISKNSGGTELNYNVAIESHTQVRIYNSTGVLVETVADNILKKGSYTHQIDLAKYSGGMYFVTMNSGPYTAVRKFFVIN